MFRACTAPLVAASAFVLLAPSVAAHVFVVDPAGAPGTFTTIQAAVDFAKNGDVVLVKSGSYPDFAVVNEGLTIAAYPGANVSVTGAIRIRNLGATKTAVLIGLSVQGASSAWPNSEFGLVATSNQGAVRCERCTFVGLGQSAADANGWDGVHVDACRDVTLTHCNAQGGTCGPAWENVSRGGAGLWVRASTVTVYDSVLTGGNGALGNSIVWDGGSGGSAYVGLDSTLFSSRTEFHGGYGGAASLPTGSCTNAAFGGFAGVCLDLRSSGDLVRLVSPAEHPGWSGLSYGGACWTPFPPEEGPSRAGLPASFVDLPVASRSLSVADDPVREGSVIHLALSGNPGDQVILITAYATASTFDAASNGQQSFPQLSTSRIRSVGTVPAGGRLDYALDVPLLDPGLESRLFFLQPLIDDAGQPVLGTPVPLFVFGSAY